LVLGNSRVPYAEKVDRKELQKFFGYKNYGTMLFTPCPGYATRLRLWRHFINDTGMDIVALERNPKFDLTTLAYISGAPLLPSALSSSLLDSHAHTHTHTHAQPISAARLLLFFARPPSLSLLC
jgi:hypothetical protein